MYNNIPNFNPNFNPGNPMGRGPMNRGPMGRGPMNRFAPQQFPMGGGLGGLASAMTPSQLAAMRGFGGMPPQMPFNYGSGTTGDPFRTPMQPPQFKPPPDLIGAPNPAATTGGMTPSQLVAMGPEEAFRYATAQIQFAPGTDMEAAKQDFMNQYNQRQALLGSGQQPVQATPFDPKTMVGTLGSVGAMPPGYQPNFGGMNLPVSANPYLSGGSPGNPGFQPNLPGQNQGNAFAAMQGLGMMPQQPTQQPQFAYARGGQVRRPSRPKYGLAAAAEQLRRRGRGGDTILAHINPKEAGILKLLGGAGTINPRTGLPEFKKWYEYITDPFEEAADFVGDAISDAGSWIDDNVLQPVFGVANDIAEALGPIGQIAAAYYGGPIGAGIYAGFAAPGDDFSWKRAGTATALTYAGGELMGGTPAGAEGAAAGDIYGYAPVGANLGADIAAQSAVEAAAANAVSSGIPVAASDAAISSISPSAGVYDYAPVGFETGAAGAGAGVSAADQAAIDQILSSETAGATTPVSDTGTITSQGPGESLSGLEDTAGATSIDMAAGQAPNILGPVTTPSGLPSLPSLPSLKDLKGYVPTTLKEAAQAAQVGAGIMTGYGMYAGAQENKKQREAAEKALAEQEAKKEQQKALIEAILAKNPSRFGRLTAEDVRSMGLASGGEIDSIRDVTFDAGDDFAKGGVAMLPPRFLSGGGDGMSDSIPARIAGKQEARLADGEFVIPADVVSHIGNGSSKAGAKKLYAMMDRVRQARTGRTRQAPAIKAQRLLPV